MQKEFRFFITLAAVILLAFAGAGCSAKAKKAYHLQRAGKFFDAGQYDRAEIEYLNVLRNDPQNGPAMGRLGVIYYEEGRLQRAAFFLAKGSQLATNDLALRLKLGFVYSAVGQFQPAQDAANYILDRKPQDDDAPLLLAEAAVKPKEIAAARQRLQILIHNGDRAAFEVALGNLALREQDLKTADAAFKRAQALDAKSSAVNAALGSLCWAQNDLKAAEVFFKASAEASPVRSPRRMQYARFKIQTGDTAGGQQFLEAIVKSAPDYVPAQMVLAEIAARGKKYEACAELLDKVLARDPDNYEALLFDSQLKLAQGNPGGAVAGMERMVRMYPQSARVHYQLALAYLAANDAAKGVSSLGQALRFDPNFTEAILVLADVQIRNNNPDPVVIALDPLVKKQPQLIQAQLLLADAYRLQGHLGSALALYRPLEQMFPQNPQIPLLLGSALVQQNEAAAARREFERAREIAPDNLSALEQLVNLDLAEKQFAAAMQRVKTEMDKKPKQVELQLLTVKILLAENQRDQAEATLLKALEMDPENQGTYLLLAQLYHDSRQNAKALAQLAAAVAKDPKNISAMMLAATIHSDDKDYQRAADDYEKLLLVSPKCSPALNNLAYLYSENLGRLDRAYELAQHARELLPFDPSAADTLGWICFKRGTYPTALALLKESAAKLPGEAEVQFHLGMADYMTGDETAARDALQRALQSGAAFLGRDECQRCLAILAINPKSADAAARTLLEKRVAEKSDDPVAQGRLAVIYQQEGNSAKAIAAYKSVLQVNPKNLAALVGLARLYAPQDVQKAYDFAKSAYQLAPDNSDVVQIFARLAFQSGDSKLAANLLRQIVQARPDDAQADFDFAQATYSIGKITEAQTAMQNALRLGLPTAQADQARRMLEMIDLAANPAAAAAASSRVAEILKAEPDNVPALMAQAALKESNGDAPAAALVCEKVLSRWPDFAPAQKQLARLCAADATKIDKAYALATKARAAYPDDPAVAKTMGVILIQKGDFSRAVNVLKESAAKNSADAEVFFYLGTAQLQLKNRAESKRCLQQALDLKLSGQQADAAKQMLNGLK